MKKYLLRYFIKKIIDTIICIYTIDSFTMGAYISKVFESHITIKDDKTEINANNDVVPEKLDYVVTKKNVN